MAKYKIVMRIMETADGWLKFADPVYLRNWNPDTGQVILTCLRDQAHIFKNTSEFMEAWKFVDAANPWRPDGEPNRPLTAFTVMSEQLPNEDLANS